MHKTILVVDYEQKSLDEIQQVFKDEPFHLLMAFDGDQALEIFEQKCPDLVITSALLPKLNGFELCKRIVSGRHGEVRPVIMFSGIYKAEKYRKEAIVGCGAVDFLEKPLAKWQLLKAVKALFSEIAGCGGGDLLDLNLGNIPAGSVGASASLKPSAGTFTLSDDVLEVEPFLGPTRTKSEAGPAREKEITGVGPAGSETSANALDLELEAAVDAVRTDLESAPRLRDEQLVGEIEADLFQNHQNILEFESSTEIRTGKPEAVNPEDGAEVIEFDEPANQSGIDESVIRQTVKDVAIATEPLSGLPTPQFDLASRQTRNWLPFLVAILVALLIILLLWVRD